MPGLPSAAGGGVDWAAVDTVTNPNDINRLFHEALATERSIEAGLDQMLSKRGALEGEFLKLKDQAAEVLEVASADADQLLASVQSTSELANQISSKVRELDIAQTRVKHVLDGINVIMSCGGCVRNLQRATRENDYETAAQSIEEFRKLEGMMAGEGADPEQEKIVTECATSLENTVRAKFDEAVDRRDHNEVLRFFKLFKPLQRKEEGLQRFSAYLKVLVGVRARQGYQDLSDALEGPNPDQADFVGCLTALFKDVAVAVEENEQILFEFYGENAVLDLIASLQQECDAQGSRIIQRFLEAKKLLRLVKEVGLKKNKDMALMAASATLVDPRDVEGYLEEVLLLCQRSEEYNLFMLGKMADAVAPKTLSPVRETSFRGGQLSVSARELTGYYVTLEEYYMEENVRKAIDIDEQVPDALTTSMVDDVFFILKKCSTRAMATASVQCVLSILGLLITLLGQTFMDALRQKLSGASTRLVAAISFPLLGDTPQDESGLEAAVYLNNADVAASYALKLKSELGTYATDVFRLVKDRDVVASVLSDMAKTSGDLRAVCNHCLDQVADGLLSRVKPTLDEAAGVSYDLSEVEYDANELQETWVQRLLAELESALTQLQPKLTADNHGNLLNPVLDRLASRIEALMMRKKFNQLGGFQLDRDVRALVGRLSEVCQRTVRDKFSRLSQMATVLGLQTVDEILDYWADDSGTVTWRLSPGEIKSIMRLRQDFQDSKIAALML
ncbi:unnamed protein product [Ostreobium quekettii]|uniref:Conserved oligomeric Golgi complex subunit 4 n=1 Tax=Ostreobium quekettii TaxID=121088 RepID=A0A8S1JDZ6_9CHLO|nr:unnamed protein product [Ostreobium quekettii]|eukprot:evm.model.scf_2708.1 EVM.evm.TU.scf_2708.1   scf_2708:1574-6721(+)